MLIGEIRNPKIAIDSYGQKIGVTYVLRPIEDDSVICYQEYNGEWQTAQQIDTCSYYTDTDLAFTPQGEPIISYYSKENNLHCAQFENGTWRIDLVYEWNHRNCDMVINPITGSISIYHNSTGDYNLYCSVYDNDLWNTGLLTYKDANGGSAIYNYVDGCRQYAYRDLQWDGKPSDIHIDGFQGAYVVDTGDNSTQSFGQRGISLTYNHETGYPIVFYTYNDMRSSDQKGLRFSTWNGDFWERVDLIQEVMIGPIFAHTNPIDNDLRILYTRDFNRVDGRYKNNLYLSEEKNNDWTHRHLMTVNSYFSYRYENFSAVMTPQGKLIASAVTVNSLYILIEDGAWPYESLLLPTEGEIEGEGELIEGEHVEGEPVEGEGECIFENAPFSSRTDAAFSPHGSVSTSRIIYTLDGRHYLQQAEPYGFGHFSLFDAETSLLVRQIDFPISSNSVKGMAFSIDSGLLAVMYHSGSSSDIYFAELETGVLLQLDTLSGWFHYITFDRNCHDYLVLAKSTSGFPIYPYTYWEVVIDEPEGEDEYEPYPFSNRTDVAFAAHGFVPNDAVIYSPDGLYYLLQAEPYQYGFFDIYNVQTDELIREIELPITNNDVKSMAFSPDSKWVAIMYHVGSGSLIYLVDVKTGDILHTETTSIWFHFMAFDRNYLNLLVLAVSSGGFPAYPYTYLELTYEEIVCTETITSTDSFIKGMNYCWWWSGTYRTPESMQQLYNLKDLGVNWVSIVTTVYQEKVDSTLIYFDPDKTMSDADIRQVANRLHCLGIAVIIKPHLDLANAPNYWRGQITFEDEEDWQTWFSSYCQMIFHYAELAEELKAEMFIIGTELAGTSFRTADWQLIITGIRSRFSGIITYAANWDGEIEHIDWWADLDLLGIDSYYELTNSFDPTVEELISAWQPIVAELESLSSTFNRLVMFTEIGYPSQNGAARRPWSNSGTTLDLQEQADCYQAALEVFWNQPWFKGFLWWYWQPFANQGGPEDLDYTPRGKPAEYIIADFYLP